MKIFYVPMCNTSINIYKGKRDITSKEKPKCKNKKMSIKFSFLKLVSNNLKKKLLN